MPEHIECGRGGVGGSDLDLFCSKYMVKFSLLLASVVTLSTAVSLLQTVIGSNKLHPELY